MRGWFFRCWSQGGILILLLILCFRFHARGEDPADCITDSAKVENINNLVIPSKCKFYPAGGNHERIYCRPKLFSFFTQLPNDYATFAKTEFKREQIKKYAIVTASTLLLIWADQAITDNVQHFGNKINVRGDNDQMQALFEATIKIKDQDLKFPLNVPSGLNSSMYFLGDGVTHTTLALGFWGIGKITKDYRAQQTGSQILEQMFASGLVTQFLKHITGRESPYVATAPGGKWRFFPNQQDYANSVPHYDAFPSGHLATAVGTVTVIAENYPEYRYIRPVGYSLCGLLAFAMVNNGVHWASDYPLSIVLGYSFGKIIANRGKTLVEKTSSSLTFDKKNWWKKPTVVPSAVGGGALGLTAYWAY